MTIEIKKSLKLVDYNSAIKFLDKRVKDVINERKPELLWILEHKPTFTAGTSFKEKEIINKKLSVREIERNTSKYKKAKRKSISKDPNIVDLEKELSEKIGLKTSIHFNEQGSSGSITLYYSDLDQLDDIMKRLKK